MKFKRKCIARFRILSFAKAAGLVVTLSAAVLSGCSKQAQPPGPSAQGQVQAPANAKVYHLHGKIISIDQANSALMIDGDAIPNFMGAMTMPYTVHDKGDLTKVGPGDEITADVIVPDQGEAYIQNVVVVKKGSGAAPSATNDHYPERGEAVPDFALIDQNGKRIHLSAFRGNALLVTFIYTRCPFPDFCPLVSKNFAHVYAETQSNPKLRAHLRLLSVSFDPDHDTPEALRAYAKTFDATTGGNPFGRWEFAVVPKDELGKVTEFFGLTVAADGGNLVHSMSTSVIGPDGKIFTWREDTDWKPADLIAEATETLSPAGSAQATNADAPAGHEITAPTTN
jgi:protein SCO1/2